MSSGIRRSTRAIRIVGLVLVAAMLLAACGQSDPGPGSVGLDQPSEASQKTAYQDTLDRMAESLEDPDAPPFDRSISIGDKQQLRLAAQRWDQAVSIVSSASPPEDAQSAHEQLVTAMRQLGEYNNAIAAAAPNKAKTKRAARKAQNSAAARSFNEALNRLATLGYDVLPAGGGDPMEGASPPAG